MNELDKKKILEETKRKIAISDFLEEEDEKMNIAKINKCFKKIGIGFAAMIVVTISSVGAYVGLTGDTSFLNNLGINIEKKYEENKQIVNGKFNAGDVDVNLVSASIDNSTLILEMNVSTNSEEAKKLLENGFKINVSNFKGTKTGSTYYDEDSLNISSDTYIKEINENVYKIYELVDITDLNLASDAFFKNLFDDGEQVKTFTIEFDKFCDMNGNNLIEGNWKVEFTFNKTDYMNQELNEKILDKEFKVNEVYGTIDKIVYGDFGNTIMLTINQDDISFTEENDIQKLKISIKKANGDLVKIISKSSEIALDNYKDGKMTSASCYKKFKVDDISKDEDYIVDVQIGEETEYSLEELNENNNCLINELKSGEYVYDLCGSFAPIECFEENEFYKDQYGVNIQKSEEVIEKNSVNN